ncbi:olee1-like protein [Amborella trichopoda]|uniref:olee1-like protein n=1 Tax=Amborella trichopoda TaxID=13333 RepID=UPI0005D30A20|nr:olee1-like protein [Amborella trichopoda]|eukprot:XP_011621414.1 olee1-like protein [Amborella trichopoda]
MAKCGAILVFCFVSCLLGVSHADSSYFFVEGKVYCDNCRAGFETRVTEYVPEARVRVECKDREGGHLIYSIEGVTDRTGTYQIPVEGDHENEICEVMAINSTDPNCNEIFHGRNRARILLTTNNGIISDKRFANPLAFLKKDPLPVCAEVLKEYKLDDDDDDF